MFIIKASNDIWTRLIWNQYKILEGEPLFSVQDNDYSNKICYVSLDDASNLLPTKTININKDFLVSGQKINQNWLYVSSYAKEEEILTKKNYHHCKHLNCFQNPKF